MNLSKLLLFFLSWAVLENNVFAQGAFRHAADCWLETRSNYGVTMTGSNPSLAEIQAEMRRLATVHNVPIEIIGAVAHQESNVYQYGSDGFVVHNRTECRYAFSNNGNIGPGASGPPGLGMMQLTGATARGTGNLGRLITDWRFNLEEGVKVLVVKYNAALALDPAWMQPLEQQNRHVLENWFYGVRFYNGYIQNDLTFLNLVFGKIATPPGDGRLAGLYPAVVITRPASVISGWNDGNSFVALPDGRWQNSAQTYFNGTVHLTGGGGGDTIDPSITRFTVTPSSGSIGQVFTIAFTVSDGQSGMARVELWRCNQNGSASDPTWARVETRSASGASASGSFEQRIDTEGSFWYGLHAVDVAGNLMDERTAGVGPLRVTVGGSPPSKPHSPFPVDQALSVPYQEFTLVWQNGGGATSYRLYFGTDSTPDSGEFESEQTATSFTWRNREPGTTYYWRVDAVNAAGTTTGDVWRFTTQNAPDTTPPVVSLMEVTPSSGAVGQVFAIEFVVTDSPGSGLARLELWRANIDGTASDPSWQIVYGTARSGATVSGTINNTPGGPGRYWYGIRAIDVAGNVGNERTSGVGPDMVTVASPCSFSFLETSRTVPSVQGSGTFAVATQPGCGWSATSDTTWLRTQSVGEGNGVVTFTFGDNFESIPRIGRIHVEGAVFTVTQEGRPPCSYELSASSAEVPSQGGGGTFNVLLLQGANCLWTATTTANWLTVQGSGSGSGAVTFTALPNPGADARIATITIANQSFTVSQAGQVIVSATHAASGYLSPSTHAVTCSFAYPIGRQLLSLRWAPTLPSGWSIAAVSGDGTPEVQQGEIVFVGQLSANPLRFTLNLQVPAGQTGTKQLQANAEYQLNAMVNPAIVAASPNPLGIDAQSYHTADYRDPRWSIDGTEVNRVLTYWRGGGYHPNVSGVDGFAAGPGTPGPTRHRGDFRDAPWIIDGTEANRVLSYWRAGGYRIDAAGADGYAAGAVPASAPKDSPDSNEIGKLGEVTLSHASSATYSPGARLYVTNDFTYSGSLLSLLARIQVPTGWTIASVTGSGTPEFQFGEVVWLGSLPPSPIQLVWALDVPAGQTGLKLLRSEFEHHFTGEANPATTSATPNPLEIDDIIDPAAIPRFTLPAVSPGQFTFTLNGNPGQMFNIEKASSLGEWSLEQSVTIPPGGSILIAIETDPADLKLFVRATETFRPDGGILVASGLNAPNNLCLDETHLYFTDNIPNTDGIIKKVVKSGGEAVTLFTGAVIMDSGSLRAAGHLKLDGDFIYGYYGGYDAMRIFRGSKNGGELQTVASPSGGDFIGIVGESLYYTGGFGTLYSMPKAGGDSNPLLGGHWMRSSAIDQTGIYFVHYGQFEVKKYTFANGQVSSLTANHGTEPHIFIDDSRLFISVDGNITAMPKNGGDRVPLFTTTALGGLVSDGSHVYFFEDGLLRRVPVSGGSKQPVTTTPSEGIPNPAFDAEYIYWADYSGGLGNRKIWKMPRGSRISFHDDFNRPDSDTVGNDWQNAASDGAFHLVVRNSKLSVDPADPSEGGATVYHAMPPLPVSVSIKFTDKNGFGELRNRYQSRIALLHDPATGKGYGLFLTRADQTFSDSRLTIFDGDETLASLNCSFQFGPEVEVSAVFNVNGSIQGTLRGPEGEFPFSVNPRAILSSGSNVAIGLNRSGNGTILPTADDLAVTAIP